MSSWRWIVWSGSKWDRPPGLSFWRTATSRERHCAVGAARSKRLPGALVFGAMLTLPLLAQTPLVDQGFDHFYNLEYPEAIADFSKTIAQNPNDPEMHNHLAQCLVFQEMFRNGALESEMVNGNNSFLRRPKMNPSPETEQRFLDEISKALAL